jgi:hypothetical protein
MPFRAKIGSLDEEEAFENSCQIWFYAPEGRAARELRELPREDRERVWADMSGNKEISNFEVQKEDPEHINLCFIELRGELLEFTGKHPAKALSAAFATSPGYICNPEFMLKFLRAKEYSVPSTVALMARYFEMKRELFGQDKIGRDILFSDLNEYDTEFMTHGAYQYLKGTDRAGRSISFLNVADPSYSGKYNVVRHY